MRIPLTFVTVSVPYSSFCCASLHHLAVVLSIPSLFSVVQPCHTVTRGSNDMYTPMAQLERVAAIRSRSSSTYVAMKLRYSRACALAARTFHLIESPPKTLKSSMNRLGRHR